MTIDFFEGAKRCKENASSIYETVRPIYDLGNKPIASFLLITAMEEVLKGIFCMLVHNEWIREEDALPAFVQHDHKFNFFTTLLDGFEVIDGRAVTQITKAIKGNKSDLSIEREANLYVHLDKTSGTWSSPSGDPDLRSLRSYGILYEFLNDLIKFDADSYNKVKFRLSYDEQFGYMLHGDMQYKPKPQA